MRRLPFEWSASHVEVRAARQRRSGRSCNETGIADHVEVDIVALVYTLILAFDRGARRNLATLRRAYAAATGTTLAPSAFYDRFTPSLAKLMKKLTERSLVKLARGGTKTRRAFGVFVKLLIADGSLVRLPDALELFVGGSFFCPRDSDTCVTTIRSTCGDMISASHALCVRSSMHR